MNANTITIGPGTTFYSVIADGNVKFEVQKRQGRGAWRCIAQDEDYKGTIKVFTDKEIEGTLRWAQAFDRAGAATDAFYAGLILNQVAHYCDGFGKYIRCTVVMHKGRKALKPMDLVGKWGKFDLPRRAPDGSINLGYHAEKIQKGEPWTPSAGCVWENPDCSYRERGEDPRLMPPIDLTVPPLDAEGERLAALNRARRQVSETLNDLRVDPREALLKAKAIIDAALKES